MKPHWPWKLVRRDEYEALQTICRRAEDLDVAAHRIVYWADLRRDRPWMLALIDRLYPLDDALVAHEDRYGAGGLAAAWKRWEDRERTNPITERLGDGVE